MVRILVVAVVVATSVKILLSRIFSNGESCCLLFNRCNKDEERKEGRKTLVAVFDQEIKVGVYIRNDFTSLSKLNSRHKRD